MAVTTGGWTAPRAFVALSHRDFRRFWIGHVVSLIGYWMQVTAMSWLVWRLTHSGAILGSVAFVGNLPVLFLGYFAGAIVDRFDRRLIVLWAQFIDMALALVAAYLTAAGLIQVWHIVLMAAIAGANHALEIPARHTLFTDLVGRDHLMSAIALNSSAFNVSRVVGPTVAGLCLSWLTEAGCFLVNALSFLAVIAALLTMESATTTAQARGKPLGPWEGIRYVARRAEMRTLLLTVGLANLLLVPFTGHLLPVFVARSLGRNVDSLGILTSCFGVGALVGGLLTASKEAVTITPRLAMRGYIGFATSILLLALVPSYVTGRLLLVAIGFTMVTQMATTNNYLQGQSPDWLRGRVVSTYTTTFVGMLPIGCLAMGRAADRFGIETAMQAGAVLSLAWALWAYRGMPARAAQPT